MTAEQVARLLVCGTVDIAAIPELADPEFRDDVEQRLSHVGLQLARGAGRWLARSPIELGADVLDGFHPAHVLNQGHMAVLAAAYLHLRHLPRQAGVTVEEVGSVTFADLYASFSAYNRRRVRAWITELRRAGFLGGEGDVICAGPLLSVLDEVAADERADRAVHSFLVKRMLQRKAREELGDAEA